MPGAHETLDVETNIGSDFTRATLNVVISDKLLHASWPLAQHEEVILLTNWTVLVPQT